MAGSQSMIGLHQDLFKHSAMVVLEEFYDFFFFFFTANNSRINTHIEMFAALVIFSEYFLEVQGLGQKVWCFEMFFFFNFILFLNFT